MAEGTLAQTRRGVRLESRFGRHCARHRPNSSKQRVDQICQQISSCPAAGGFGKFLQAVTGDCKSKHFDGYFGLDGMTFVILDWTADNLPPIFQACELRDKTKFDEIFGKVKPANEK